jgi:hypothetical protein
MALSFEEYKALRQKGLSAEQVARLDSVGNAQSFEAEKQASMQDFPQQAAHLGLAASPWLLGVLGSVLGGAPGAFAGGFAGKGIQMAGEQAMGNGPAPQGWQGVGQMALAGGEQLAGHGIGKGLAMLAPTRPVATAMYRNALNPSASLLKEFPGLVQEGMAQRLPVSEAGKQAAIKTAESRAAASAARLDRAAAGGMDFGVRDIAGPALRAAQKVKGSPLTSQEIKRVMASVRGEATAYLEPASVGAYRPPTQPPTPQASGLLDVYGNPIPPPPPAPRVPTRYTPTQVATVGKQAGREASTGLRAAQQGKFGRTPVAAESMRRGATGALNRSIPGYQAGQQQLQSAMGLERAMIDAANRNTGSFPISMNLHRGILPNAFTLRPDLASAIALRGQGVDPILMMLLRAAMRGTPQAAAGILGGAYSPQDTTGGQP